MQTLTNTENSPGIKQKLQQKSWTFYVVIFGVVLPVVTLFVELAWAWCAQALFDPLPTMFHVAMIAIVPVANLLVLLVRNGRYRASAGKVLFLNGIAIGVSAFYTILFIPVMPIAAVAIIWGIGLLPLAPLLSLIAAIMCRRAIPRAVITDPMGPNRTLTLVPRLNLANWGIVAGLMTIIAVELPFTLTEVGLRMATSQQNQEQLQGVRLLRSFADHDRLLSYSYARRGRPLDMISFFVKWDRKSVSLEEAREVYFRVTGRAFNDAEPVSLRRRGLWEDNGWLGFDFDQGGEVVGKKLKDLQLSDSVIDGSIDADAAIAYLEWTFEFTNRSSRLAEARAQISLPPGAVVSRVTLWVNGEEREAAFAGRGQARQAYEQVVQRQRDPILVTTAGADTVLVQMFPVPVDGKMKARIGITAPLGLNNPSQAVLRLPQFKQRNFYIDPELEHSLWLEAGSDQGEPAHLIFESGNAGGSTLREKLTNAALEHTRKLILVSRDSRATRAYAIDHQSKPKQRITQHFIGRQDKIDRLVIVVDGSKSMREYVDQLSSVVLQLPATLNVSIIVAADEPVEIFGDSQSLAEKLREFDYDGGIDNTRALEKAWLMAASDADADAAVLWIHGSQPVILNSVSTLRQNWRRRADGPPIYDFPLDNRVNRIAEALDDVSQFKLLPRVGGFEQDLTYQMQLWGGKRQQLMAVREAVSPESEKIVGAKTSDHLVRLWANDRIHTLIAEGGDNKIAQAIKMAAAYQLVTPVSGAVVLETQQQYDENGLQPVPEGTVPTIPEPETWLLIIATLTLLSWVVYRRRKQGADEGLLA